MGAGLSNTLQKYVLRGWEPEGHAPRNVENDARVLLRYAFTLAEVCPPSHCNDDSVAQPPNGASAAPAAGSTSNGATAGTGSGSKRPRRPLWLEPSLLHVLFVSTDLELAEAMIDGLKAASPLATVVQDPHARDGGALAAASKAGFGSYAFIDAELRTLRLWTITENSLCADAKTEHDLDGTVILQFFDLIVWLIGDEAEEQAIRAGAVTTSMDALESERTWLQQELERARAAKLAATRAEEFADAKSWKIREAELSAKLQAAEAAAGAAAAVPTAAAESESVWAAEAHGLRKALEEAQASKRRAIEAEDFKEAQQCKVKEKDLEAKLAALKAAAAAGPDTGAVTAAPSARSWQERLGTLSGSGRPPALVVGVPAAPRALRSEASRAGLPPDRIRTLPRTSKGQRPGLCAEPDFWSIMEAGLRIISANRDFPADLPQASLPSGIKLGASVRLRNLEMAAGGAQTFTGGAEHGVNGWCGVVVGHEGDKPSLQPRFLVRLWDGEVVRVVREELVVLSFKLGASAPVQLINMERMKVRLRLLKSRQELNGREGEADDQLVNGRYTVSFKDGTIAAKPENIEVIEPACRELQGSIGIVDARDAVNMRYKVLLVKTTDRTEERSEVRLHGLRAKPALNGQEAKIASYNPGTERFTVLLKDGSGEIAVKRQNFEFLQSVRIEALALSLRPNCIDYFLDPDDMEMLVSH